MTTDPTFARPPRIDGGTLVLEPSDADAAQAFFRAARGEGGFLVPLPRAPALYQALPARVVLAEGIEVSFEARVIQAFPSPEGEGQRVAFQLEGWSPGKDAELARKLRQLREGGDGGEGATGGEASGRLPAGPGGTSPIHRIKGLNVSQRMRLAAKADRNERQILLRDGSPQVLMGLLSNPRLDAEDVVRIVRSTHVSAAVLKRVAEDRRWSQNAEVRASVVRNPKTPTPLALRLLETLRTPDLQVLAKSNRSREAIKRAAVRLYLKRIQKT